MIFQERRPASPRRIGTRHSLPREARLRSIHAKQEMEGSSESSKPIRKVPSYRCPVEPPPRSDRPGAQVLPPSTSAPAHFLSTMSNRMVKKSAAGVLASLRGSTYETRRGSDKRDRSRSAALAEQSKETGLAVAHSSSRPAQGVGGCLLPTLWPFGDTQHNPFPRTVSIIRACEIFL